jgi:hypothetical protein
MTSKLLILLIFLTVLIQSSQHNRKVYICHEKKRRKSKSHRNFLVAVGCGPATLTRATVTPAASECASAVVTVTTWYKWTSHSSAYLRAAWRWWFIAKCRWLASWTTQAQLAVTFSTHNSSECIASVHKYWIMCRGTDQKLGIDVSREWK